MKKVVSGELLKDKMFEAINLLCDTVKCTLGPKGSNVIIDHSNFSPFITNDGVTIAESIESDDEVINVILELAKEASVVTNESVGDGTTTTLVILQSLFNSCMKLVSAGENPILLKKQLYDGLQRILSFLLSEKKPCDDKTFYNIAKIASGDDDIASAVSDVFLNIPFKEAVSVKEVENSGLNVNYYSGYSFQSVLASLLFLKNQTFLNFKDCLVLIIDDVLSDLKNLSIVLNEVFSSKKGLIIIANDFSSDVVNYMTSYVLNDELNCLLVKISDYGLKLRVIEKDLEVISGAKIVNNENEISVQNIGYFKNIYVTNDDFRVDFASSESIGKYVSIIKEELKDIKDDFMREFYFKRISMFNKGTVQIEIGEYTKTELREKRMRLEDAICAVYSSSEGVLIGGGITLLKISNLLDGNSEVDKVWREALEAPFKQLMYNSGLDYDNIKNKLDIENYRLVYNIYNQCFEDVSDTYVVDPYKVVVNSLINACSIASMLITTNSLVINEKVNNLNKITEYGDI